ncbi:MAG: APC family permease, partial [Ignavibacteria bacterium]|nr:APC family permease [Ignavibacteria bacterium]
VGVGILTILNLRGVKEAVVPLIPIFMSFVFLHAFAIIYTIITHSFSAGQVYTKAVGEFSNSYTELGLMGTVLLIMKSFSMGAGTYTGIEAVSNGLPILRDPKVKTAHKTMRYISVSLSITVMGIMFSYLLFNVHPSENKTLNAIAFESLSSGWDPFWAKIFMFAILFSEAALLFIAAQTGFLDGPRVLSNMALDKWMPSRFANLSDRLVTKNGILLMGVASFVLMALAKGSVSFLVVLYSINVFITFCLSQLGMVRHWWQERKSAKGWQKKLLVNAIGLIVTTIVLITVIYIKFEEGGWITIVVTGSLVFISYKIKQHYSDTFVLLKRLDEIVDSFDASIYTPPTDGNTPAKPQFDPKAKTAVVLVNGYNGLGAHTLLSIFRMFPGMFKNFIFLQVGSIDAGSFKGAAEVEHLTAHIQEEAEKYVDYMNRSGYFAEAITTIGTDVVEEIMKCAKEVNEKYKNPIFFGGQLVFPEDTFATRFLHNYIVFTVQREFYFQGYPFVILPIRV